MPVSLSVVTVLRSRIARLQLGISQDIDKLKEDVIGSQTHIIPNERRGDILEKSNC